MYLHSYQSNAHVQWTKRAAEMEVVARFHRMPPLGKHALLNNGEPHTFTIRYYNTRSLNLPVFTNYHIGSRTNLGASPNVGPSHCQPTIIYELR